MLHIGEKHTVFIESMNIFANGVCHIDGMAVFVRGAVNGEECEVIIAEIFPKYAYAELLNVIKESPFRIKPSCTCFRECGGCAFLNTTFENENKVKSDYVKSILKKNGFDIEVEKTLAPVSLKYRNKVVLFFDGDGYGYKEASSERIVAHDKCLINLPVFDEIAAFTAKYLGDNQRALYIRKANGENGKIMVCPIFSSSAGSRELLCAYAKRLTEKFPSVSTVLYSVNNDKKFALENCTFEKIYGDGYIKDTLCGLDFIVSPKSFYQVNHDCAEMLYEKVISLARLKKGKECADLFCGTGTIGLILAKRSGAKVTGIEIEPSAVCDAKKNAEINGCKNITFFEGDAAKFNKKVSLCIVDPPRKGCSPFMLDKLLSLAPKKIIYVSCNPDTLARDLKKLSEKYQVAAPVSVFNMFPRTSHVETVVCLTNNSFNN